MDADAPCRYHSVVLTRGETVGVDGNKLAFLLIFDVEIMCSTRIYLILLVSYVLLPVVVVGEVGAIRNMGGTNRPLGEGVQARI